MKSSDLPVVSELAVARFCRASGGCLGCLLGGPASMYRRTDAMSTQR